MASEPENLTLELLRAMRADISVMRSDISDIRGTMATKSDVADLRSELKSDMHTLRADMAADLLATRKDLGEQIVGLRRAVIEYHTSVIGHGVLISELEGRVRRIEQRLDLTDG